MLVRNQKQSIEKVSFEDQDWKFYTMSFAKYISKQFGKDSDNKRHSSIPFGIEASENRLGFYLQILLNVLLKTLLNGFT